jgi:hypothetical protein
MHRVFIKDHGRYRAGDTKDYPIPTWKSFFPDYEKFTRPVVEIAAQAARDARKLPRGKRNRS